MLMQPVLEFAHDIDRDDHRNDMSLITRILDVPDSEPRPQCRCLGAGCHRPRIDEIRMDHDHSYDRSEIYITLKDLGRTYRDQYRKERQSGIGEHIQKPVDIVFRHTGKGSGQTAEQSAQKTRGDDRRDDRYEYVS